MVTIIAGSRDATAKQTLRAIKACPWADDVTVVVSGTARGADRHGEWWGSVRGLVVERYPADWRRYGRRAGMMRNHRMAERADGLIAVWDGRSRGTANMIDEARRRGLRVFVYRTDQTRPKPADR